MCPLWPFSWLLLYVVLLSPLWLFCCGVAAAWDAGFSLPRIDKLKVEDSVMVTYHPDVGLGAEFDGGSIEVFSEDPGVAEVTDGRVVYLNTTQHNNWTEVFNLTGKFLGRTEVKLRAVDRSGEKMTTSEPLKVSVVRRNEVMDKIFGATVATLVSLAYVNMGCEIDLSLVKKVFLRPIGPLVGLASQFVLMPLFSYGLSMLLFDDPAIQLGMFVTGCSPGGGASNMWTLLLDGNLNLSVAMTFISTSASFAMMPLWLFTLGKSIFSRGGIVIPYSKLMMYLVALVVPLAFGVLIKRYLPRCGEFLRKMLRPFSLFLILFILTFGIAANLYMFEMFTWQLVLGGFLLPFLGYLFGFVIAKLSRLPVEDTIAISIETGVQNTGIAIFLLQFSLDQPDADMTKVVPVASATMTPWVPLAIYLYQKIKACRSKEENPSADLEPNEATKIDPRCESPELTMNGDVNSNGVAVIMPNHQINGITHAIA